MDFDDKATIRPINGSEDIPLDQNVLQVQPGKNDFNQLIDRKSILFFFYVLSFG